MNDHPTIRHAIDVAMAPVVLASLAGKLPLIAAGFACIWYLIQFYEYVLKKYRANKHQKRRQTDR